MNKLLFLEIAFSISVLSNAQSNYQDLLDKYNTFVTDEKYDSALVYAKKTNDWVVKYESDTSLRYSVSLFLIGTAFYDLYEKDSTIYYWSLSMESFDKQNRKLSYEYSQLLNNYGNLLVDIGKFEQAESYYWEALSIRTSLFGEEHASCAKTLNNLGYLYMESGNFSASEQAYIKALTIRIALYGEVHPDVSSSLLNLGVLYYHTGDYRKAKQHFEQSLETDKLVFNENHAFVADGYLNLGTIDLLLGDYSKATNDFLKAKAIYSSEYGELHPYVGLCLNNLGLVHLETGDYQDAEQAFVQSLRIKKQVYGTVSKEYANGLVNLAVLLKKIGDYSSAINYYSEATGVYNKIYAEVDENVGACLNGLGTVYFEKGNYLKAQKAFNQALLIFNETIGNDHLDYADVLHNLGETYLKAGECKKAEECFLRSIKITTNRIGEENRQNANNYASLSALNLRIKNYELAEEQIDRAIFIVTKTLDEKNTVVTSYKNAKATICWKTNREAEAYNILSQTFNLKTTEIAENFEWLNNSQKEAYWKKESNYYDQIYQYAHESFVQVPKAATLNYDAALLSKSKLLEAKISKEDYYLEVDELREELSYRKKYLIKLESDGSEDIELLGQLRRESDSLDKRLTLTWPAYAEQKRNLSITWQDVQRALEKEEVAIEFVRFYHEDDSVVYYNALLLRKNDSLPILIKLCTEDQVTEIEPKRGFSEYYKLIWQPIQPYLEGINVVYYSPIGELNNVPFNAIYIPKSQSEAIDLDEMDKNHDYLLDRFVMNQLTSTRYLALGLKTKMKTIEKNSILMVGGVNYDYLPGMEQKKKSKKSKKGKDRGDRSSNKLKELEGTKKEVENIGKSIAKVEWSTTLLESGNATEENVIKHEGKEAKRILHLATHGYAFPEYDFTDTSVVQSSLQYAYRYSQNPMVRSGLILAGGNWAWTGSDTLQKLGAEQNGILTALEVSQLNLRNTQLVVLSACETGLGLVDATEGTFGLKRGFKLAGVEQIIVSLWTVPDKETMELMTAFYQELVSIEDPVQSFHNAQKKMRHKYPNEPHKWAGFVLVR